MLCHLTTEEQQSKKGSSHSFTRNIVFDMGIEAVDKYLYLLAGNKIQKSLMDFIQELECTFHKKFTHSILLKLLIHTACLIERTLINGHELKIISEDDTRSSHETIFHVKKAFKNIETEFGITVSYDECFFIYDIIASK
ncbi:PRD domain-containing protein [Enterococcus faecium]|uniref:PRD domain-containing protein n=1 Tax=Enterococcus faecium TaxID=1352 RepID=UPI002DBA6FFF|nr:PRD domain-containing protein [Enterococcus faecium]MEB5584145.1 PRD domain-containing protein [Enterococcus faecium]